MIKLVIFDLDGTLIEFHHDFLLSESERIFQQLAMPHITREILQHGFERFNFFHFIEEQERIEFEKKFWEHFDFSKVPRPKVLPGAEQILSHIADRQIPQVIVTARTAPEEHVLETLQHTCIPKYIERIVTRVEDDLHWSDKRQMLREICAEYQTEAEAVLLIGDTPADIKSAEEIGITHRIAVLTGGILPEILVAANPTIVVNHLEEFYELHLDKFFR
ncbi:HAD family hydrolase [bacterium]|nr:HAD family hydrolase [bacterium]